MDKSLTYLNKDVDELRGTVEDKDKQIEYLHVQHLYPESYSQGRSQYEANRGTCLSHFFRFFLGVH